MPHESKGAHGAKSHPDPLKSKKNDDMVLSKTGMKKKQRLTGNLSFSEKAENYMAARLDKVLWLCLALTIIFGFLLFDAKISTGGDDSSYIEMGYNFIKGKAFPSWHGTFYSMFLGFAIMLFGINITILKAFSFLFIILHLVIFYYTFRKLLSPVLFSIIMLIVSVNTSILYFASQTYSEALYMFLQALVVLVFARLYSSLENEGNTLNGKQLRTGLLIGLLLMLMSITRNIGIIALFVSAFFLVFNRKYKAALVLTFSCVLFLAAFAAYKSFAWKGTPVVSGQLEEILLKNTYNSAEGREDLAGMVTRFFLNARLYLSKHFMIGIGMHDPASIAKNWFSTFIISGLLIYSFLDSIKKDRIIFFIALYTGASLAATFIALQVTWDQMRMVIIYIPMMLVLLSWGTLQLSRLKNFGFIKFVLGVLLTVIFFSTLGQTIKKVRENRPTLAMNLRGDKYSGFTPDWQNFLKLSEWAGSNISDSTKVASRKASMSFIYSGGKEFYGIYRIPTLTPGEMASQLERSYPDLIALYYPPVDLLPADEIPVIKTRVLGLVVLDQEVYGFFNNDNQFKAILDSYIKNNAQYLMKPDSFLTMLEKNGSSTYAVYPDSLLNELKNNKVGYLILASLRANPFQKNGRIINTVQRYVYFIDQKYPGLFQPVTQTGADDDEPAALVRIDYGRYGL